MSYGFPDSSFGNESACNAGDPSLTPGLGKYPGEGKGYPLQYSGLVQSTLQLAPCSRGYRGHITVSGSIGPSRCRGQKTAKAEITLEMSLISDDC